MLSRISKRSWFTAITLVLLTLFLSGCAPSASHTVETDDLLEGNFWEKYVVYYFAKMLDTFADWFGGEYGFAILLMVIIVRTLILPLTLKQYRSSKAMQAIQPELQKIKEKHKDNPQKQQEETMKLFQQHQVNPLAGCLPLFVQMPIFIALYNSIYWNPAIREHSFLGIKMGVAVNDQSWYAYVLPLVAAITTYIQSKMMQSQQKGQNNPMMPAMNSIMLIFPVLIFVMALSLPAALPFYWIFSNVYTIIQNYFLYVRSSSKDKESAPAK
ncbi:YidC/Oxa1 family membrane protein insertase [Paenibacillus phyllosphaerae]|uniref:YidC/Oxa1 family membrane protein insertase n=1 Tax=Paenibacillus phyllosphaerae TaxID=274593 RepID=A0A7W5AY73_9BACL|nr:YidC/Oxa1 family membrane protein insertase [Paenibacillus phyllosphaerae]MBB3110917.1 YidC/Oxa1 family membrane protein insertase [Paenibacillus phyllosphaerae]